MCKKIYNLRNDFLHGNDVEASALMLEDQPPATPRSDGQEPPQRAVIDFAACIYRLVLTGALDIKSDKFQRAYEDALLTAAYRYERVSTQKR